MNFLTNFKNAPLNRKICRPTRRWIKFVNVFKNSRYFPAFIQNNGCQEHLANNIEKVHRRIDVKKGQLSGNENSSLHHVEQPLRNEYTTSHWVQNESLMSM